MVHTFIYIIRVSSRPTQLRQLRSAVDPERLADITRINYACTQEFK